VTKPVCLVIGAGAGIGGNVAIRFAREGYHACLVRRSDKPGLDRLIGAIENEGGTASGFIVNTVQESSIENLVQEVEADIGPITVAIFNLGAQIGDRALADTSLKAFEMGWRLATFGLFRLASALLPRMEQRGKGALLVTSATAAMRGNAGQHSHASAMAGRRMLCQTLNAQFAASLSMARSMRRTQLARCSARSNTRNCASARAWTRTGCWCRPRSRTPTSTSRTSIDRHGPTKWTCVHIRDCRGGITPPMQRSDGMTPRTSTRR